jgi:hypothetical protein
MVRAARTAIDSSIVRELLFMDASSSVEKPYTPTNVLASKTNSTTAYFRLDLGKISSRLKELA